jgi:hypothetical protein
MALNKSKDNYALFCHVAVYTIGMFIWSSYTLGPTDAAVAFTCMNAVLHFVTDWMTSRINSKLWFMEPYDELGDVWRYVDGRRHWFFVMVGFDQLIHYVTLAVTLRIVS